MSWSWLLQSFAQDFKPRIRLHMTIAVELGTEHTKPPVTYIFDILYEKKKVTGSYWTMHHFSEWYVTLPVNQGSQVGSRASPVCPMRLYISTKVMSPYELTQRAHDVKMTSYQRRCDVMTLHRRRSDVTCPLGINQGHDVASMSI